MWSRATCGIGECGGIGDGCMLLDTRFGGDRKSIDPPAFTVSVSGGLLSGRFV